MERNSSLKFKLLFNSRRVKSVMRAIRGRSDQKPFEMCYTYTIPFFDNPIPSDFDADEFSRNGVDVPFDAREALQAVDRGVQYSFLTSSSNENKTKVEHSSTSAKGEETKKEAKRWNKSKSFECVLCRRNNEPIEFYRSHSLRDTDGKVQCPILRLYCCPVCNNNGGDDAHTIRYCPKNVGPNRVVSIMEKIKMSRNSTGKCRKISRR